MIRRLLYPLLFFSLVPAAPVHAVVIEDFEDGNIIEYTVLGTVNDNVTTGAAHDGTYGLEIRGIGGNEGWIYRDDGQVHNQQGDIISYWVHTNPTGSGRVYIGFGASAGGCYSAVFGLNTATFMIQSNIGYGYVDLASAGQAWQASHWYRVEITWGTGTITAVLYDSDGSTPLNTINANDNAITNGGLAFRAFDNNEPTYVDTITLNEGSTAVEPTSWGRVRQLFH